MGHPDKPVPTDVDVTVPSVARMYDYFLGGKDNYAADRGACEQLSALMPSTQILAINNRRFLQRVVRWLASEHGVWQYIDHGSGLPTQDNVHQVAQRVHPDSRVVYVDNDPIVVSHSRAVLEAEAANAAIIKADMRHTDEILAHEDVRRLIDFDQPVAALFVSVLHCLPDHDTPGDVVRRLTEHLAPGSFVVICQLVSDDEETREKATDFMLRSTRGNWGGVRSRNEVKRFFDGLEIQEPGLVEVSTWRPDSEVVAQQPTHEWIEYGGVGLKR